MQPKMFYLQIFFCFAIQFVFGLMMDETITLQFNLLFKEHHKTDMKDFEWPIIRISFSAIESCHIYGLVNI